jgi:hypothetical protein
MLPVQSHVSSAPRHAERPQRSQSSFLKTTIRFSGSFGNGAPQDHALVRPVEAFRSAKWISTMHVELPQGKEVA